MAFLDKTRFQIFGRHRSFRCIARLGLLGIVVATLAAQPALGDHSCTSPLILDLDGGGIQTTGLPYGVSFDIDGDGFKERIGWTFWQSEEAFLWLDLNHNGTVDDGTELFGTSTILPSGELAPNGFEALAVYDEAANGGNEDGVISHDDLVWRHLRLWIDESHDAISQPTEIHTLTEKGVLGIGLNYRTVHRWEGTGNLHELAGGFVWHARRFGFDLETLGTIEDVYFVSESP